MTDYFHDTCPNCGRTKYHRSRVCWQCYQGTLPLTSKHTKEPCPSCGRPKLLSSILCNSCQKKLELPVTPGRIRVKNSLPKPDWSLATDAFMYQFVGLFMGEGCIHARASQVATVSLSLQIKLRSDEHPALEMVHKVLGGALYDEVRRKTSHGPAVVWIVTRKEHVIDILKHMRPYCLIPMRKIEQVDLALEFYEWRATQPFHGVDREIIRKYYEQFAKLKELPI